MIRREAKHRLMAREWTMNRIVTRLLFVAIVLAATVRAQTTGWTLDTVQSLANGVGCNIYVTLTGFGFDPQNRGVVGVQTGGGCGSVKPLGWARKESGAWNYREITTTWAPWGESSLVLADDGTPFYGYPAIGPGGLVGVDWVSGYDVDLDQYPTGAPDFQYGTNGGEPLKGVQSCVGVRIGLGLAPGSTTPNLVSAGGCQYTGFLMINYGGTVFGTPSYQYFWQNAGTTGEVWMPSYAIEANGAQHLVYYADHGGQAYGAYYSTGAFASGDGLMLKQPTRAGETSMVVGADGRIHVALGAIPNCNNFREGGLLYMTSADGVSWTEEWVDYESGHSPSIALDANGEPHIAYWYFNHEVRYATRTNGRWRWSSVHTTATDVFQTSVRLAFDRNGVTNIAFFDPTSAISGSVVVAKNPTPDAGEISPRPGCMPGNSPPVASTIDATTPEDTPVNITLTATDADNDPLTFAVATPPSHGTATLSGATIAYTPAPNFNGSDSLAFSVDDGHGGTATAHVNIVVTPVNDPPVLTNPGAQSTAEGTAVSVQLQATDVDGDALTFGATGLPAGLQISASGLITGAPTSTASGVYSVVASVSDGQVSTSQTFSWTVIDVPPPPPSNRAPICTTAAPSVSEIWPPNHQLVGIGITGITDPDHDALTVKVLKIFQDEPTNGDGDGETAIDGFGIGASRALVRAERSGRRNGRVYYITFSAVDPSGASCTGTVSVGVPHDQAHAAVGDGPLFDSTKAGRAGDEDEHHGCGDGKDRDHTHEPGGRR
jgi:hypothetical protein